MLRAKKKSERETRKLRCAKPRALKSSRRRMKPILSWTKSKAEAYTASAAPKGTFPAPFSFAFLAGILETACGGRRSSSQPPLDARFSHERSLLPAAFSNPNLRGVYQGDDVRVKSGHDALKFRCPLYPRKRTFAHAIRMSALVESRMGAVTWAVRQRPVSHPRSSNRTCQSPASGSPTGFTPWHTTVQ